MTNILKSGILTGVQISDIKTINKLLICPLMDMLSSYCCGNMLYWLKSQLNNKLERHKRESITIQNPPDGS